MSNVSLIDGHIDRVKKTNFERIKYMSINELAELLAVLNGGGIVRVEYFKKWLESEVDTE